MSHPFSSLSRRRFEPTAVQQALRTALHEARRHGENLLNKGKRNPRAVALTGVAVVLTLGGAYALSASGSSMCPPPGKAAAAKSQKGAHFLLLMDPLPKAAAAGSELEINYDVCGLPSGSRYTGAVRLQRVQAPPKKKNKKKTSQPKPQVLATFEDKTDGVASREHQQVDLGPTKPGTYTLELIVADHQGRARKRLHKIVIQPK
jgi:hypothetical protein